MKKIKSDSEKLWHEEAFHISLIDSSDSWLIAACVIPFFSLFELNSGYDRFIHCFIFFSTVACIIFGLLLLKRHYKLPSFLIMYGVSLTVGLCCCFMAAVTIVGNIHFYLLAISTITLSRGLLYFGTLKSLLFVSVFNFGAAFLAILFFRHEKLNEIPDLLSTIFFSILFIAFALAGLHNKYNLTKQNFINGLQLKESIKIIAEKHKEISDSINYAERIQKCFLATNEMLNDNLNDYFVLFQPKDVVSGDFYWADKISSSNEEEFLLATADSTGHGVPGAIMSLLNITSLEEAVKFYNQPADILNHTRNTIIERLKKDGSSNGGKDGMDCSLISIDFKNNKMKYACANNPIWVIRKSVSSITDKEVNEQVNQPELLELKPDKMPVGKHDFDNIPFTPCEFKLQKGDCIYTFTDGFPDQFGGLLGKKFMYKKLKELLLTISQQPMELQKINIQTSLKNWMGEREQVDDITLIGVRV